LFFFPDCSCKLKGRD